MTTNVDPLIQSLREDFRHHLERFYACLHLAPPYHSVEKAIRFLSTSLQNKPPQEREQLSNDFRIKWDLFELAFVQSVLPKKHHGIIRGLIRSEQCPELPEEYAVFTQAFLANQ